MPVIHCRNIEAHWHTAGSYSLFNAVHAWRIHISAHTQLLPEYDSLLNNEEKIRAASCDHESDRNRFILSRGILRTLLSRYAGEDAHAIQIAIGENKKPYIQATRAKTVHYNMAHSGDVILIGIAGSPLGIDVEHLDTAFDYTGILPACFSEQEQSFICNAANPRTCFYQLWTRKEALLKATAKGIDDSMPGVPCLDGTHNVTSAAIGSDKDWYIYSFEAADQYAASIAVDSGTQYIELRTW